jgi:hypothetical protein
MHAREEECIKDFGVKEGKRPLGRPIQRWKATIKMNLREIEWGWFRMGTKWRAVVDTVMNIRVFLEWLSTCWLPKEDSTP